MPTSLDAHSTPVRHGKFYFSDGNVIFRVSVLVTCTTRQYILLSECYDLQVKETLYKLHKSLLAGDSDVFAGMFSLSDAFDTTPNPKNLVLKHFEGASDQNPIVLEGQDEDDFDTFLTFYYPAYV